MTDHRTLLSHAAREAYAVALPCWIWGYPLVETLRTCAARLAEADTPVNQLHHDTQPSTHHDRWVVTPANDLLYSTAWVHLADGPVYLDVPAPTGRYFVMALLDAHTNNWCNIGPEAGGAGTSRHAIVGPDWHGDLPADVQVIHAPTDLVWLIGRILVDDASDLAAAQALQQGFALHPADGRPARAPASVTAYDDGADPLAFFGNLARGLTDFPVAESERGLVALWRAIGIRPGVPFMPDALAPDVRQALAWAAHDARDIILAATRSARAKPWGLSLRLGVYGDDYRLRAATAMKGLGALAGTEAVYALADFDADRAPLSGEHDYILHFPAGELPPADAFWSVTLYGEDFFLVDNPIARYALGDRTRGLEHHPDGSLTLYIQHAAPAAGTANWLPAPAGPFYLILRMYRPGERVLGRAYQIPPVQRVPANPRPEEASA
ncbi:DUF1254 domain-containing protein [Achromobacter sp. GG226]|uniref:DUF1254 domain-containing protein n=1 Tax=Verticiella alkaliphila TaxID=2779529 RepID=UPI001C0BB029|nr:DUF1254 domain-containing protein [Verticiella sp. GG226]MBU4610403.1 DUF1254 domain-containing protein [Verticiella sp. GG226]